MKTETLREFITLAQCLNYSTTADSLFMSQARLSVHISDLEKEIGYPLFTRKRPLALTPEGKRFLEAASLLLNEFDAVIAAGVKSSKQKPEIITVMRPALGEFLPNTAKRALRQTMKEFSQKHPRFDMIFLPTVETCSEHDAVTHRYTDFSYVFAGYSLLTDNSTVPCTPAKKTVFLPVLQFNMEAWLLPDHPLSSFDKLTLEQISAFHVMIPGHLSLASYRQIVLNEFAKHDLAPVYRTVFSETSTDFPIQLSDEDIAIVPECSRFFDDNGAIGIAISDTDPVYLGFEHLIEPSNPIVVPFVNRMLQIISDNDSHTVQ
jgi:DNA-binding transcriptional LysR family regulator